MSLLHPTNSMETDRQQKTKGTLSTPEILDFFANLPPRPYTELQGHRERCIQIIQKFHGNRTKEEEALLVSVLKQFNFLENASEDDVKENKILSRLSQILEYEVFPAGTPICHKGELGNKFYLIIKGRAIAYSEQPIEPQESAVQKSFRGHQHNSSQLVLDCDSFSGKSFLLPAEQQQKVLKRNRSNIFQPRIVKRDLNKLIGQGNIRVGDKKFSRENPPQTTWDVDRVLSFIGPITRGKLASNSDGSKEIDEKYVEMLLEYKLLEAVAEKLPGKYVRNGQFLYRAAKSLREGDFFGEHALVTNRPRNVTVIANQDLHCFTISKMDYQHVSFRRIESISPNIQFLQKFFPEAAKPALIKIAHLFEECRYTNKQVIFEEDNQPDGIYFIKEGKVQLSKRIKNKADQFYVVSEAKQALKNVIAILGNGDIFGDEEVFLQKNREFSATVTSNDAIVLKLDKKVYDSLSSEHKSLFYNLGKTSYKPKRSSKSQPKAPSIDGRTFTENIETKKSAIKWPEYQEVPTGNSYDIFSKFSGFVEINSAKVARSNNFFEDQSLLLQHQKQPSLNTNILSTTVSSNVITMTRPSKKVTPTDNLSRGSKKFFKRIFYQDEIHNKDKEKSQTEPSEPLTAKTESQYEAEAKPYILRLDTDIGAPTPEVDINNNKLNVPSQTQNDYMLVKAQNRFKDSNNSDNNKSLQKKKGSLKKIIEFRLNLELPQTSSRKETRGTTTAQTNVSVNLSQDESSGVKEGESSSVMSLKKAWRPPTAGGYYSVQTQKLSSSREKVSPANLTLLKRLHSQKTTRERTETYEFSGNVSTRVNTSHASKRRSNLLKPRPSPREDTGEEDLTSSKTGKSFAEYFKGLTENEGVSGRRTANTPTRANVNSNTSNTAISKSMVKMRTTTEFFKKREDIRNRMNVSGEKMLTVQTLLFKPC